MVKHASYDYVVVGAGTAGCVLAHRLSADPATTVALVEAGGRDRMAEIRIPVAFGKLFKSTADWDLTTTPQPELGGRALYWPRGKVLGGSSSMNAQMWVRGTRADFDGWATAGCPGWGYDDVLPYFQRAEHRVGDDPDGTYGTSGPIWISDLRSPNPTTAAFLSACAEQGLGRVGDSEPSGYASSAVTQRRGRRWSASDAYLRPAQRRSNLTVLTGTTAQRIVLANGRAVGVEVADGSAGGLPGVLAATREVILCAGAVGSPHLLQLSGIGDPRRLREAGIPVAHELPAVGAHLQDHLMAAVVVRCRRPVTLAAAETPGNLARYLVARRGMLTSNVAEAFAMTRSTPSVDAPDIELIFAPTPYIDHGLGASPGHALSIGVVLLQPDSSGHVTTSGPDPTKPPRIDPGYLTAPGDRSTLVRGVELAQQLLATRSLAEYAGDPIEPGPYCDDAQARAAFVREQAETVYHPVGTCRMGSGSDAVVDPRLRVIGIDRLRVVDASVMPRIIRGHPNAATVMIAERGADLITDGT